MTDDGEHDETALPPDDVFGLLGNETRIEILSALGEAGEPLGFSALHDRVDMRDSGQFNYHLEQLVGHFVRKTADGYTLTRMGRRVIEAVLSGTVTETPTMERTPVAESCEYCGGAMEISWQGGSVRMYCTECAGRYGHARAGDGGSVSSAEGYLGRLPLPPAGVHGRTPVERLRAAWTWGNLEVAALSTGICPRCSATVETTVTVCESHDAGEGLCDACLRADAIEVKFACTNCIYESGGAATAALYANTELLAFLTAHGLNPIAPDSIHALNSTLQNYEEEILSTDPLRARLTFGVDGETLALTVDEELTVVESAR
ncbi:MAG: helix-turn-helix domain-containing protein [Halovenus sp.]